MNHHIKKLTHTLPSMISVLVTVALLISLVAFLSLNHKSAAWFSQNKEVSANGISVTVKDLNDFRAQLQAYAVTDITGLVYTLADEQSYTLPSHDPNSISYNAREKALIVLIELCSYQDQTVSVTLQNTNPVIVYEQSNMISNCMKITPATYDATDRVATSSAESFSFVTFSETGTLSKGTLLNLANVTLTANVPVTLCYIIEYNQQFFDHLFQLSLDFDEMIFSNDIDFVIDFA